MKSLMLLWKSALDETGAWCRTSTARDYKYASSRFEHEGVSFLTITLPAFGKDLEKALSDGCVAPDMFLGFKRRASLPLFLGGFLELVFDRGTGLLLDEPLIDAINAIRQLTLMFGKIRLECNDARKNQAISSFIECEKELRASDAARTRVHDLDFVRVSGLLLDRVLARVDRKIGYGRGLLPKHGPGKTADRLDGNQKYRQNLWTSRLESVFPMDQYLIPNARYWRDLEEVKLLEPGKEIPVRIVLVPKTLKTPRVIAIEPTHMQYMQQAIANELKAEIRRDDLLRRFIDFEDQTPNQDLARDGSLNGCLSTLDLSEASDRVSNQLVRLMLSGHPHIAEGVDATRSRSADVPRHGVIRLAKYASMGSALTFPVEALVFLTCVFIGIERGLNKPLTRKVISDYADQVQVYGDDIIVPTDMVQSVISVLHEYGFKVNMNKSFWTGKFRESCGKEFYDGHDVSIVRVRDLLPRNRQDGKRVIAAVALRNNLYQGGLWTTAKWMDNWIASVLGHKRYPTVAPTSPVLGRHTLLPVEGDRICRDLQRPLVKGYVVRAKSPASPLDGRAALLKYFLNSNGVEPVLAENHLERFGRPKRVDIKLGWHSVR